MKVTRRLLIEMIEEAMGIKVPGFNLKIRVGDIRRLTDEIGLQPNDEKELNTLLGDRPDRMTLDLRELFGEKPYMKWTPSSNQWSPGTPKTTFTKNPGKGYFGAWFAIARAITQKAFNDNPEVAALNDWGQQYERNEGRDAPLLGFKTDYAYMVGRGMLGDWKESYRLKDSIQDRIGKILDLQAEEDVLDEALWGLYKTQKNKDAEAAAQRKAKARETFTKLKSGETTLDDIRTSKADPLDTMTSSSEEMMSSLGPETREEKLKRLKKELERRKFLKKRTMKEDEGSELKTVGELLELINNFRQAQAGKAAGKKALDMMIEQIPGLSNVWSVIKGAKDTKEMMSQLYGLDDTFKSNTGLDMLNIDDNISKIVDNKVETAFLNSLMKQLGAMDKDAAIPNVEDMLHNFLRDNFEDHTVKK